MRSRAGSSGRPSNDAGRSALGRREEACVPERGHETDIRTTAVLSASGGGGAHPASVASTRRSAAASSPPRLRPAAAREVRRDCAEEHVHSVRVGPGASSSVAAFPRLHRVGRGEVRISAGQGRVGGLAVTAGGRPSASVGGGQERARVRVGPGRSHDGATPSAASAVTCAWASYKTEHSIVISQYYTLNIMYIGTIYNVGEKVSDVLDVLE